MLPARTLDPPPPMQSSQWPSCLLRQTRLQNASSLYSQHVRVYHVDRFAARVGDDLLEDVPELDLVFFARHVADVRRADDILHPQQRILWIAQRLLLVVIDGRHP